MTRVHQIRARTLALSVSWLMAVGSACAPKAVPLPIIFAPRFPEFMKPVVPAEWAAAPAAVYVERGWTFLQAGDLKEAERELGAALRVMPAFYPAETALGYLELGRKDPKAALARFDRALGRQAREVSALVGRGQAHLALDEEREALAAFEAAVAIDPSLAEIARRVEVLRFRNLGQDLADARAAARAGRLDDAIRSFGAAIARSPGSSFLYRELAAVEQQKGDTGAALEHFRTAAALDPGDAASRSHIGDILEARGDLDGAIAAYTDALSLEPGPALDAKLDALRQRAARARLPAEYRAIDDLPQITRADLAALIGVRLAPLLEQPADRRADAVLVTDIRAHWAATWILAVARAGVMEPFANHAFQPRATMRRIDLAPVVGRLLARIAALTPGSKPWTAARLRFPDLSASHLAYPAASVAVASGVLQTAPDGRFQPSRAVSGADAIEAIQRLASLANLPESAAKGRP